MHFLRTDPVLDFVFKNEQNDQKTKEDSLIELIKFQCFNELAECIVILSDSKHFFPKVAKLSTDYKIIGVTNLKQLYQEMNVLKGLIPVYKTELASDKNSIKK